MENLLCKVEQEQIIDNNESVQNLPKERELTNNAGSSTDYLINDPFAVKDELTIKVEYQIIEDKKCTKVKRKIEELKIRCNSSTNTENEIIVIEDDEEQEKKTPIKKKKVRNLKKSKSMEKLKIIIENARKYLLENPNFDFSDPKNYSMDNIKDNDFISRKVIQMVAEEVFQECLQNELFKEFFNNLVEHIENGTVDIHSKDSETLMQFIYSVIDDIKVPAEE
ncbi:hypothetical protein O3M35_008653 [Rhynocoris fuscipes]|uniref:Uncharacterized protein n=1 Tax=Rhynocoris fuscipes TaxID=488301 RepID=A0AAW1D9D9_9HEMI